MVHAASKSMPDQARTSLTLNPTVNMTSHGRQGWSESPRDRPRSRTSDGAWTECRPPSSERGGARSIVAWSTCQRRLHLHPLASAEIDPPWGSGLVSVGVVCGWPPEVAVFESVAVALLSGHRVPEGRPPVRSLDADAPVRQGRASLGDMEDAARLVGGLERWGTIRSMSRSFANVGEQRTDHKALKAEGVGFEPTEARRTSTAFEAVPFVRSGILPGRHVIAAVRR